MTMRNADVSDNQDRNVVGVLAQQAKHIGDDLYLLDDDGASLTYGQVDSLADRYANALSSLGLSTGDTVAFLLENSAEQAVCAFGANRLGVVWSPVNTDYRGEWLGITFDDIRSNVLIVDAHLLPRVVELPAHPFKHIVVRGNQDAVGGGAAAFHDLASFAEYPALRPDVHHDFGDTNAVMWTSGTTGRSKGVMQSHNSWITWADYHNRVYRNGVHNGERFYGCTPMYNSGGWIMNIYPALLSGVQACIDKRFSVSGFWDRLRHYEANFTMTLGTMHLYLMQQPPLPNDADNPLRQMVMNPVIPQILDGFKQRFGVERITAGFGQSEIMGATLWADDLGLDPASCGLVDDEDRLVDVILLDDQDEEVPVGEVGEICVRGRRPYVLYSGYFNSPDKTLEALRNLWHHSGDLGRVDEKGELYFVDRKKDSTRHKGRSISSFEVEHIARQFPGVAAVAAVGVRVPGLEHEDELMVCIIPRDDAEIDPLEFCRFMDEKAPYFFVPRYVSVLAELPMTPTGKIQKFKIREQGLPADAWDLEAQSEWRPTKKDYRALS
jgi:crotonobetaine/carnitine-CoA ligase